jgi:thymidylate synthase ThyX
MIEYKKIRLFLSKKLKFNKFSEKVLSSIEGEATDEELKTAYSRTINAMHKDSIRHLIPLSAKTSLSLEINAEAMRQLIFSLQAIGTGESLIIQQLMYNEASKLVGPLLEGTEVSSSRAKAYNNFISQTRKPGSLRMKGLDQVQYCFPKPFFNTVEDPELGFQIFDYENYISLKDEEYDIEIQARMKGNLPDIIINILREQNSGMTYGQALNLTSKLSSSEKEQIVLDYAGIPDLRTNRRYRPGRGFEAVSFDKTLMMPIAEIRDLRRHTIQSYLDPKYFTPENGFYISEAVRESGMEKQVKKIMSDINLFYDVLRESTNPYVASTILTLAHKAPMNVEVNARNQHHIDELRTQPGASPLYLRLCQRDYVAVSHLLPILKKTMTFVNKDSSEIDYGRSIQEVRRLKKIKKARS